MLELLNEDEEPRAPSGAHKLPELAFSLLINTTAIEYAYFNSSIRHTDYPSGEKEIDFLLVVLGKRLDLVCSNDCQKH